MDEKMLRLNIGCGLKILPGYVNCDYIDGSGVDEVFDVTKRIPYPSSSVDEILVEGVFGHIFSWHQTPMNEIYRVLKPGGVVRISEVCGFSHDPFHVRYFFSDTMKMFNQRRERCGTEDPGYCFELLETNGGFFLDLLCILSFVASWLHGPARTIYWILRKPLEKEF